MTIHSQKKFGLPWRCIPSEGCTTIDQSIDSSAVAMHSQRKLYYDRSILRAGDAFPAKVVLRSINPSPLRYIPSGSCSTVDQSFTVTIHSQRKFDFTVTMHSQRKLYHGRSILRASDAFPAKVVLRSIDPPPWRCIPSESCTIAVKIGVLW